MREKILGVLFFLFAACFIAIVVEELFIGGRRKRQMLKKAADAQRPADETGE